MNRLKLNRWLITLLSVAMLMLFFWPSEEITIPSAPRSAEFDYFMDDIVIHQYDSEGSQTNRLMARRMEHSEETATSYLNLPQIIYRKSTIGQWQLSSTKGTLIDGKVLNLLGKVSIEDRLENDQVDTQITTKNLTINLEKNTANTKELVSIENPRFTTQSNGMSIDFSEELILLESNVSTIFHQPNAN